MNTQQQRVLAASRAYNGTCAADFAAPNVCDGGKPIMRVPARIGELQALGFVFEIVGWRGKTKVYRLLEEPVGQPRPPAVAAPDGARSSAVETSPQDTLFGLPRVKGRHGFADQEHAA